MIKELIHFGWIKKDFPVDYFRRFLYRKEVKNYYDYLSYRQYKKFIFSDKIIFPEITSILNNKLSFAAYLERLKLPTPKMVSHNLKNNFFYEDKVETVTTKEGLIAFFTKVLEGNSLKSIILKPMIAQGGRGILLVHKENLKNEIHKNAKDLLSQSYIHQEVIEQHSEINNIHSGCVNTLRIETYIDNTKKANILSAVMRFGSGNSFIDNIVSGGFYISIDLDNGQLKGVGRKIFSMGIDTYTQHPDSKIQLEGFKIPFFKEACELALKAAEHLPNRIIGWDIAITPDGPVIIEGNHNPGMDITDIAYGGYCKHPMIKEILSIVS